jgi:hypothetical protein
VTKGKKRTIMGDKYTFLTDEEYYARFGIKYCEKQEIIDVSDKEKLEKAYQKAWETRDFEINKFWTRAAYFWGFIAVIFAGYISVITGDSNREAINQHIDLYLILLGIIFSVAWLLVIKGSKRWQENWEAHIGKLEDYVTGPLYKTIYYDGKTFYSVSRISECMAFVVIITWVLLLVQNIISKYHIFEEEIIPFILCAILGTIIIILLLIFKYGRSKCMTDPNGDKTPGKFFDGTKKYN